jgi:hypothetical protein
MPEGRLLFPKEKKRAEKGGEEGERFAARLSIALYIKRTTRSSTIIS